MTKGNGNFQHELPLFDIDKANLEKLKQHQPQILKKV